MNLYICGSNRKHNSYNLLKEIKRDEDILYSLQDLNIKFCLGCMPVKQMKISIAY